VRSTHRGKKRHSCTKVPRRAACAVFLFGVARTHMHTACTHMHTSHPACTHMQAAHMHTSHPTYAHALHLLSGSLLWGSEALVAFEMLRVWPGGWPTVARELRPGPTELTPCGACEGKGEGGRRRGEGHARRSCVHMGCRQA